MRTLARLALWAALVFVAGTACSLYYADEFVERMERSETVRLIRALVLSAMQRT